MREALEAGLSGHAVVHTAAVELTNLHILDKIEKQMREADLCVFDLTTHNANVALEFGLARGAKLAYRLLHWEGNERNPHSDVFSDARGWDSLRYRDLDELERLAREILVPVVKSLSAPPFADPALRPHLSAVASRDFNMLSGQSWPVGRVWNDGFPASLNIEYEDSNGVIYEQRGAFELAPRGDAGKVYYSLNELERPKLIPKYTIPYSRFDIL